MKSMLAILAACFLLTACRAGSDDAVAPDNAYGSRSLRLGADPYVAPEGSVITLEAELSNAVAGKTVSFFVVQGQAILERATAQTNQYGKAVITATLASPGPIKFKATCVGYGVAYTEVLTEGVVVEIDGYVYGEPNRKIDNMVQRYTNDDPHDDVNLITRGYVKFVADIQTAGQPPANLAYEWPVSGGQSETDIYRDDLDWNAPADETEVSIILMVFQGGILFGNNQAAAKAVGPRVARVKFEGDGAITLLDEDKGKIEPPQYDRFDTTWETGHEADLNHDHLKNAEGKLFKNESVAYVRGGKMQIVADLAGGDADIVGPGAGYALRLSVVGNLPGGFPFKLADPNNAVEGSNGTESEVELIKWKDLDYRAKTTFVSDKALGENPSKIRFYWETTLKWTIKVKEFKEVGEQKITEWVNAWPGNATWDTVHRSLCVANAKPKKPIKFFQAGDTITIGADNVAWEKVMQYSCDWTNGEGGEGGNEATIVDAAFTKMSQKNTVGTGARLEINYTLKFGNDRLVRKMLVGNEVQQGDQKTRVIAGSCGAQSGLFAAVCNAQGIEVATERMNLHAPDVVGQRRAVKIAVPFKDVDDDWCDHSNNTNPDFDGPRDADGNPLWWYNSPISSLQVLGGVGCD